MSVTIPELCLVVLVGASGSGKSTFARKHFKSTEVLSSDYCRGLVSDNENDQTCSQSAFEVLHYIAAKRLSAGRLTVIDATSVQEEDRRGLLRLAKEQHCFAVAIVLNVPETTCLERNQSRPERDFGDHVIKRQSMLLRKSLKSLKREGFKYVHILSPQEIENATIERTPLWTNKKAEKGPFDIIGDIHGCYDELRALLIKLGYQFADDNGDHGTTQPAKPQPMPMPGPEPGYELEQPSHHSAPVNASPPQALASHPEGRKAVFVGDLVDRGPNTPAVLRLVMNMVRAGNAYCVAGNHDVKLMRKLKGADVKMTHGLQESMDQLADESEEFKHQVVRFMDGLISHYQFDGEKLVVAHAGLKQAYQGRTSTKVRDFCLYGETTGETDSYGLPVRYPWAQDYRGTSLVVYGHTPVGYTEWINKTICLDTGCVFGGQLTALRYPELTLVSVAAAKTYYEPVRPLSPLTANETDADSQPGDPSDSQSASQPERQGASGQYDLLDISDVIGKRVVSTRLRPNVNIREENAITALEVMSRFAIDPRWLIYLPPTMSPCETSSEAGYLEHPRDAFKYYQKLGVSTVVCQEKHMGSRAVVVVCRNAGVAAKRFGVGTGQSGACYTRTGRPFFHDDALERSFIEQVRAAADRAQIWEQLNTDWLLLDCELMPWSAKAQELLRQQYAAVGASGVSSLTQAVEQLSLAAVRLPEAATLHAAFTDRLSRVHKYRTAYRHYCWKVEDLQGYKLAPFHLLASEGAVHVDKNHLWHMEQLSKFSLDADGEGDGPVGGDRLVVRTPFKVIELANEVSVQEGIDWWQELTGVGGEGMVVKPLDFIVTGERGLVQPAVKCRGREYLRIIYGPEYSAPHHLERLRSRALSAKRSLALRELALGIEAMERFVAREPLYRVHECVFSVLALESEPVDPRL